MNFETALTAIQNNGFRWELLSEYFPFGDISLREGNYLRLVQAALAAIKDRDAQQVFLDLLDAQGCVFTEQVWVANQMAEKSGSAKPFPIEAHFSTAWLQINDNLRLENGLQARGARSAMLALEPTETLALRITRTSNGSDDDA